MISTLRFERRLLIPFRAKKDVFWENGRHLKRRIFSERRFFWKTSFSERRLFSLKTSNSVDFRKFQESGREGARSNWKENGWILISGLIFFNGLLLRSLIFVLTKPTVFEKTFFCDLPLFNQIVLIFKSIYTNDNYLEVVLSGSISPSLYFTLPLHCTKWRRPLEVPGGSSGILHM